MFLNFHTHFSKNKDFEILNLNANVNISKYYFSIAYHPKDALNFQGFSEKLSFEKCVAIGECGMDKNIEIPLEVQEKVFTEHVKLSEKFELPLIIHCVKAWNEILAIKTKLNPKQKWIFHGFRKTSLLDSVLKNDILIGIGPAILFDQKLQKCLLDIPLEKILIETDNNESTRIEEIYLKISEIKKVDIEILKTQIFSTFREIFTKWQNG